MAQTMIGQALDDPALGDSSPSALRNHPLKLALQGSQAGDPLVDLGEAIACDRIGGRPRLVWVALELEQRAYRRC